ncbi:phage portal protein [Nitrosomonas oligotropha]|nr:phage portal protein [Nitrosomonas oligotropha]MXS81566.1 phage portal protein [Nitrosomonas oligotropha]
MGFISNLEAETRSAIGPSAHPRDPVLAEWFGAGGYANSGVSVTPDSAMRVTAVFRAVALLSGTYASLPVTVDKFMLDGGLETDKNHPLYDIIVYQPNKWQTSFQWREMMAAHFALRGCCYSEIISSGKRGIDQLIPLHPDRVRPFHAPDGKIAFGYTPPNGPQRVILQDDMHWMHFMASDGIKPISPISYCREAVGLSLATEEHAARLFSNGAKPGGILKMPGHFKDDIALQRFKKEWQAAHGGVSNTGKTAVLEDGLEWQQIGMTSEDAQFLETRNLQVAEIARIFGVPPHKLFDLQRSTNNNIEHQGIEFVTDTIRPGCVRWEQDMQRDLFNGKRTHCVQFDLDGLMRGDSAARAAFNSSALQNGWKSRNEVRRDEGYNRSNTEGMDDYTVQSNMISIVNMGKVMPKQPKEPSLPGNSNE